MQPLVMSRGKSIDARKNYFFASPGPWFCSNNHTNIHQLLCLKCVFCRAVEAVWYSHAEAKVEESRTHKYLNSQDSSPACGGLRMTTECFWGLSDALYRGICFSNLISLKESFPLLSRLAFRWWGQNQGLYMVARPVNYCMHQGHKICIFSLNAS